MILTSELDLTKFFFNLEKKIILIQENSFKYRND